MYWPGRAVGAGGWHGLDILERTRVQLPDAHTTGIEDHCLEKWARHHVAEPGHGWVRWEGGGEVEDTTWADACLDNECCIVGPLTDRTKTETRMETGIFGGFLMKSSEYILSANGEATTARTIRRRPVSGMWANPEEIINVPVFPWE